MPRFLCISVCVWVCVLKHLWRLRHRMFYTKKSPSCGGNCCWYWMPIKKSSGFYRISYYKPEWKRKEISKHDASYTVYTLVRVTLRYLCKCVCVCLCPIYNYLSIAREVHRTTAKWAIDTFVSVRWGDTRLKLSRLWAHTKQQTKRNETNRKEK